MSQWQLPSVIMALLAWLSAPTESLGDLARKEAVRRALTPKSAHTLLTDNLPSLAIGPVSIPVSTTRPDDEITPVVAAGTGAGAAAGASAAGTSAGSQQDEKWWRAQMAQARDTLDRDRLLAEAVQGRINSLTTDFVNRDDPAQRAQVATNRQKALQELDRLQKQIVADEKAIADLQKAAHRQGIPPGWIR